MPKVGRGDVGDRLQDEVCGLQEMVATIEAYLMEN
jgi:hypothetical protein